MIQLKRNLELIREILLAVEASEKPKILIDDLNIQNYTYEEISYHIRLLMDASYIEAFEQGALGTHLKIYIIYRLTSFGHDYLDTVRDSSIWNQTKNKLGPHVLSASLELVKSTALSLIQKSLGI